MWYSGRKPDMWHQQPRFDWHCSLIVTKMQNSPRPLSTGLSAVVVFELIELCLTISEHWNVQIDNYTKIHLLYKLHSAKRCSYLMTNEWCKLMQTTLYYLSIVVFSTKIPPNLVYKTWLTLLLSLHLCIACLRFVLYICIYHYITVNEQDLV